MALVLVVVLGIATASCAGTCRHVDGPPMTDAPTPVGPSADLARAVALGVARLGDDAATHKLVRAENDLTRGSSSWRLVFKLVHLIPEGEGIVGKGGETFVLVDTATGEAEITGYGE